MKHQIFLSAGLISLLFSCTNDQAKKNIGDSTTVKIVDTITTPAPVKTNTADCYQYIQNRDTATLQLKITGDELTGELNYNLFEKDKNKGKIAGELKGDTIIAEYTFDSEGLRSVREVIFVKKADGKLYEGFGEVEEKGGKTVFKNRSALKFDQGMAFSKADCK